MKLDAASFQQQTLDTSFEKLSLSARVKKRRKYQNKQQVQQLANGKRKQIDIAPDWFLFPHLFFFLVVHKMKAEIKSKKNKSIEFIQEPRVCLN